MMHFVRLRLFVHALLLTLVLGGCTASRSDRAAPAASAWTLAPQESGTDALLVGLSPVSEQVVWVGGASGTVLRTTDGGSTWQALSAPGPDSLQFRDVEAVSRDTVYLLSAGPGAASRIYKTTDGGTHWTLQFQNEEPDAFFDCMAFWDARNGMAFSDAVDGAFIVLRTEDGGAHWRRISPEVLPDALPGEASFAASGTCLAAHGDSMAWFGTAAADTARVFRTPDRGRSWSVRETPLVAGASAGIASLVFRTPERGAALGGDLRVTDRRTRNVALTMDGGQTWQLGGRLPFPGAAYGAAFVPGTPALLATGPQGMGYSRDGGKSWTRLDTTNHWSVAFARSDIGWAVGPDGRITKLLGK